MTMPSSEKHGTMPFASFRRSIMNIRQDQVHSKLSNEDSKDPEIDTFQNNVFARFHDLSIAKDDEFLSIAWVRKLLDVFTACQEDFRVILNIRREQLVKSPVDKVVTDLFERSIKALDICNATRDGIEKIRQWQKHLEIVVAALDSRQKIAGEGQFRRARKTLMDLALIMLDEKDTGSVFSRRNRSFGRHFKSKDSQNPQTGHSRSLSWSVSHNWSAAKQLQTIASNLAPPRSNENPAVTKLLSLVFSMSFILMFVLWALVAAIPCQDRSLQINFTIPRQFPWSTALLLIHSRIMKESKKPERQNSSGLLKEIYEIEKCVNPLSDFVDGAHFPLSDEQKVGVAEGVKDLMAICDVFKSGLDPLERQLRDVFRKIMSCRTEGIEFLGKANE